MISLIRKYTAISQYISSSQSKSLNQPLIIHRNDREEWRKYVLGSDNNTNLSFAPPPETIVAEFRAIRNTKPCVP